MVAHCDDEQKPPFGHLQAGVSPEEAQAFMQHKQRAADIATADALLENHNWLVQVYNNDQEAPIAEWRIDNRTEHEAAKEAMADLNEYSECEWTMTELPVHDNA